MRRHAKAFVASLGLLSIFVIGVGSACAATPTLTIDPPSGVSYTSAHLSGTINPHGGPGGYFYFFEYRRADQSGWEPIYMYLSESDGEATSAIPAATDLTGLEAGAEYIVRLRAEVEGTEIVTPETSFTTDPVSVPAVAISAPSAVSGTSAHLSGTIDPEATVNDPAFEVAWHFECTPACPNLSGGTLPADSSSHTVEADATGLVPNTEYEVTLVAKNAGPAVSDGPESFTTGKVAPQVEPLFTGKLGAGEAILRANVNPRNSAATYQFEWGTTTSYGNVAPASPAALGAQDNAFHMVSVPISGLAPGTSYHFRVVATNTETGQVTQGEDRTFQTASTPAPESCPNELFRIGFGSDLPDCRAYEQVSPTDKNGLEVSGLEFITDLVLLGPGGDSVQYMMPGAMGDTAAAHQQTRFRARRDVAGWTTHGIDIPQSPNGQLAPLATIATSKDLSHSAGTSFRALAPGAVEDQWNLYLRDNDTGALTLVFTSPTKPFAFQWVGFDTSGGTPDFDHFLFREIRPLTDDAPDNGKNKLYDFHDGELSLVSYGPGNVPTDEWVPSGMHLDDIISADGSHVFYTLADNSQGYDVANKGGLYERVNGGAPIPISASQRTGEIGAVKPAKALWVSDDGSAVIFETTASLLDSGVPSPGGSANWIYRYENGQLTELTNLGSDVVPDARNIQVAGNGEYVYFEQFLSKKYLWHAGHLEEVPAVIPSQNGRFAVTVSERKLTGYDNSNPDNPRCLAESSYEVDGCPEVFVYDSLTKELECASCGAEGQRPAGPSEFGVIGTEKASVTNDGTVFFTTPNSLVSTDTNGRRDVYQFRDGHQWLISSGAGNRDSLFAGASPDGSDAFFLTADRLVSQDTGVMLDLYDARVGGGLASQWPPDPPAACGGEICKGPATSPSGAGSPGSSSFAGPSQRSQRAALARCQPLQSKARSALRKAKGKPPGKRRKQAFKAASKLQKKASKCKAGAA